VICVSVAICIKTLESGVQKLILPSYSVVISSAGIQPIESNQRVSPRKELGDLLGLRRN